MKIDFTFDELRVIQDALDASSICRSGCYMNYKSGDKDLCFGLNKNGEYACKLIRNIDSINSKIDKVLYKD